MGKIKQFFKRSYLWQNLFVFKQINKYLFVQIQKNVFNSLIED